MTCKTVKMPLSFLVEAVGGSIQAATEDKYFESVTTDSREVLPGMLFIALRGDALAGGFVYFNDAFQFQHERAS